MTYNGQAAVHLRVRLAGPGIGERRGRVHRGQGSPSTAIATVPAATSNHDAPDQGAHDRLRPVGATSIDPGTRSSNHDGHERHVCHGDARTGPTEPRGVTRSPTGHQDPVSESADAAGLRVAFLAHGGELYGYARRSLGDPKAAEDIVQETFIRAWRARDRFDTNLGTLRTWLFTIARRVVIDHARARAIRQTEPLPPDIAGVNDDVENAMVGWQMEEALSRLRPDHRQVLIETYYRGRSGREVADELGHPRGNRPQSPLLRAAHPAPRPRRDGWDR